MDITLWNAKVNTRNMTDEQARENFGDTTPQEEITRFKKAMQSVDGLEIIVTNSFIFRDDYVLVSWKQEDDDKWRDFIYEMEQDSMFGTYCDDREGFLQDWKDGKYEPEGSLNFEQDNLIIMSEVKKNSDGQWMVSR